MIDIWNQVLSLAPWKQEHMPVCHLFFHLKADKCCITDKDRTQPRLDKGKGREISADDDEQDEVEETVGSNKDRRQEKSNVYHHEIYDRLVAVASGNGAYHYGTQPTILSLPC